MYFNSIQLCEIVLSPTYRATVNTKTNPNPNSNPGHRPRPEGSDTIPNHVDRLWNHKESCEESWNQLESARITTVFRIEIIRINHNFP